MKPIVALLSYSEMPELYEDDRLLIPALAALGVEAVPVVWDDPRSDWPGFDAVVIRETWDYFLRPGEFRAWLDAREADGTNLWNPVAVCRWNMDKRYLLELASAGVPVVQTEWCERGSESRLDGVLSKNGWEKAVVKPAVSAGAHQTWVVTSEDAASKQDDMDALLASGDVMIQPFIDAFLEEGEWSFFFFNGRLSHAALKRPADGDFRVQPRWGGTARAVEPPDDLARQAASICDMAPGELMYARVDGVRVDDRFLLVELEILEPFLYLELDADAPAAMAAAIFARLR